MLGRASEQESKLGMGSDVRDPSGIESGKHHNRGQAAGVMEWRPPVGRGWPCLALQDKCCREGLFLWQQSVYFKKGSVIGKTVNTHSWQQNWGRNY